MKPQVEIERPLPRSIETEKLVLGVILVGHPDAGSLISRLTPDDFCFAPNREICTAICALAGADKLTDLLSVSDELQRTEKLEAAGGLGYLSELGDGIPQKLAIEHHVRRLKDLAAKRTLIRTLFSLYDDAFTAVDSAESLLDQGIEKLSQIARNLEADRDSGISYRDAAAALLGEFDSGGGVRIFTDIDELDRLVGGFRAGELVLFTAETGVGKTLLAQQTRRRACRDGRHTLFCSGEMRAQHLISRELATEARVEHWKMRRPERLSQDDMSGLVEAASRECFKCHILDGELSITRIRRVARQLKSRSGLDLVIVDYDELVEAPGNDEFDRQRYIVRAAKSLAMELKCPIIVISQLRKTLQGEDRNRPTLQRLYGSGAKAKHSSVVIYVDRPFVQELLGDETEARIVIAKNRDGKVGAIEARFNIKTLRFEGVARPQAQQRD